MSHLHKKGATCTSLVLLLLFRTRVYGGQLCMSTKKPTSNWHATRGGTSGSKDSRRLRQPRALDDEIEGSPGAQRPDGRSAKNGLKKPKKLSSPPYPAESVPVSAANENVHQLRRSDGHYRKNCNCGTSKQFSALSRPKHLSLHQTGTPTPNPELHQ